MLHQEINPDHIMVQNKEMNLNNKQNNEILLVVLKERYESVHKIRERVQTVSIWSLGLLLGASGWIIQSKTKFNFQQQVFSISGIILSFIVFRFMFLEDLLKGFRSQQQTMVRIEKALGLFTPNTFNKSKEAIYPKSWEDVGKLGCEGKFFNSTFYLIYVGIILLILTILGNGFQCSNNIYFLY